MIPRPVGGWAIERSAAHSDFIGDTARSSIAGQVCAVVGCTDSDLSKCVSCPAHYCPSHARSHLHVGVPSLAIMNPPPSFSGFVRLFVVPSRHRRHGVRCGLGSTRQEMGGAVRLPTYTPSFSPEVVDDPVSLFRGVAWEVCVVLGVLFMRVSRVG